MYGRSFWQEGVEAPERLAQRGGGCPDSRLRSGCTRLRATSSGGRCPCSLQDRGTRCPFRVASSSNDSVVLCHIVAGRTAMDTRNKCYGMRAEQLHQAAAAPTYSHGKDDEAARVRQGGHRCHPGHQRVQQPGGLQGRNREVVGHPSDG